MNTEALDFGEYSEGLDLLAHSNVALFEQYEPFVAMNDDSVVPYELDDCALDNLYLVPAW
jgi:hypothetical protein